MLAALASAFHRQAVVAMEAEALAAMEAEKSAPRAKPNLPEYRDISLSWR